MSYRLQVTCSTFSLFPLGLGILHFGCLSFDIYWEFGFCNLKFMLIVLRGLSF